MHGRPVTHHGLPEPTTMHVAISLAAIALKLEFKIRNWSLHKPGKPRTPVGSHLVPGTATPGHASASCGYLHLALTGNQSGPDFLFYLDSSMLQAAFHLAAPLLLQDVGFLALLSGCCHTPAPSWSPLLFQWCPDS